MSNKNLEKGDRVMLVSNTKWRVCNANPLGVVGTVVDKEPDWIYVRWDNREKNSYEVIDSDLMKVIEVKNNKTLWEGDRVMMLTYFGNKYQLGIVGTVDEIKEKLLVKWDNGFTYSYIKEHNNLVMVVSE